MKLDKYLNEGITKVDQKKLSGDSKQDIVKMVKAFSDFGKYLTDDDMKRLLDSVINNVFQDGYDSGYKEGLDDERRDNYERNDGRGW